MNEMYFTIAGCNHYFGTEFMEKGMKLILTPYLFVPKLKIQLEQTMMM